MKQISVRNNNGRCLLRWKHQGKNHSLTLGDFENKADRAYAERLANQIYLECLAGNFDETLERYKPRERQTAYIPLNKLLETRLEAKYNDADKALLSHINEWGKQVESVKDAIALIEYLRGRVKAASSLTRYLNTLKVIRPEHFKPAIEQLNIKPDKGVNNEPAFSVDEVRRIREHFRTEQPHHYAFISFLFLTGCRTSEAIGIRRCDISLERDEILISESLGRSEGKSYQRIRKGTKTGKSRVVPLSSELKDVLMGRLQTKANDELLLTSPNGLPIDDRNFSQRNWRKALKTLGIEHRRLYSTRHTFVSHCIEAGMNPVEIASITGHDVETLYKHYARLINKVQLPDLYA